MSFVGAGGGYNCSICGKYFSRVLSGRQHEQSHQVSLTRSGNTPCPTCGKLCRGKGGVNNHSKAKHPGQAATWTKEPISSVMVSSSASASSKKKVGKKQKNPRNTPCPTCGKRCRGQQGVKDHSKCKHPDQCHQMYPYGASARPIMAASFLAVSPSVSYLNENKDFLQQAPRDLNKFISNNLQPTTEVNYMARDKVKRLVNFHQHNFGYSVKEVVVSGSFGKGTQVKGFADLDCVLILNDIKDHKELKAAGKDMFKNLEEVLRKSTFATITDMKKTRFALQFDLEVNGEKMGVDLLPTFDTSSRDARRRRSLYQDILQCTWADRQFYSAALCHLQIEFIKKQPTKLKNLIRLVKYWNKTVVKPQSKTTPALRYPSSYPLELISTYVCEKIGDKESFDMAAAFKAVMQQVVDYKKIIAVWHDNYDEQMADKGMREMEAPILLDPANPTNNVLLASDGEALEHVAQIAKETLMKPLLRDVSLPFKFLWS